MDAEHVPVRVAPYPARPGRRVLVALDLADLQGPVTGTVELPLRLFWSGTERTFDVSDQDVRRWIYETVLQNATRPDELATLLDGTTLVELWPQLYLPKGVRRAWEDEHPVLRATAASAV